MAPRHKISCRFVHGYKCCLSSGYYGLAAIVLADPVIRKILFAISATYLTYLALRIAFSGAKIAFISMSKPGWIAGLTLQFINPKAYAVNTMLFSGLRFIRRIWLLKPD